MNSSCNKQPPQFKGQVGARATEMIRQCIYFLRFVVENTNRTHAMVQGTWKIWHFPLPPRSTVCCPPEPYLSRRLHYGDTPSTGNRRASRFIALKYCSLYRSICSSTNREQVPWAQQQASSIKSVKAMYQCGQTNSFTH